MIGISPDLGRGCLSALPAGALAGVRARAWGDGAALRRKSGERGKGVAGPQLGEGLWSGGDLLPGRPALDLIIGKSIFRGRGILVMLW